MVSAREDVGSEDRVITELAALRASAQSPNWGMRSSRGHSSAFFSDSEIPFPEIETAAGRERFECGGA